MSHFEMLSVSVCSWFFFLLTERKTYYYICLSGSQEMTTIQALIRIKLTSELIQSNHMRFVEALPICCNNANFKPTFFPFILIIRSSECMSKRNHKTSLIISLVCLSFCTFFYWFFFFVHVFYCYCTNFTLQNHSNDNVEQPIKDTFAKEFELIVNKTQHHMHVHNMRT